jgi:dipeptidyl aminopeptidase/acylaminoacyl peptidase
MRLFLLAICFAVATAVSAQKAVLSPEIMFQFGRVTLEDVSPDGSQVLYTVTKPDLVSNTSSTELFLMPTTIGKPVMISGANIGANNARFDADGDRVVYLNDDQLVVYQIDTKQTKMLSNTGINGFTIIPSSNSICYAADVKYLPATVDRYADLPKSKGHVFDDLMFRHWKSWEDYNRSNLFVAEIGDSALIGKPVNIMADEPYDAPMKPMGGMEQVSASPDGRYIAYTCKKMNGIAYATSTNSDVYLYDRETGKTINVSAPNAGYDIQPVFSPDSKLLIYNSMARDGYESDLNRLAIYDLRGAKVRYITQDWDFNTGTSVWSTDGKTIYSICTVNGLESIYAIDPSAQTAPKRVSPADVNYNNLLRVGNDLMVERVSMTSPVELFMLNPTTGGERQMTYQNTALLSGLQMGEVKRRMVKTTDGKDMLVYVILPPNFDATKKYPALLYCQGGPQSPITQSWSYRWNFQLMASQGYVVVAPCRRGMPGFGQAWNEQISGDWGGQCMKDLLSGIDDVAKEPWVDKNRLGAVGASFGGYSVYWLAGHHNNRFKAFISHCGVFNNESMYATTEEQWFNHWDFKGAYWDHPNNPSYQDFSPHRSVQKWNTPMMVIHCEKDFRVPLSEGMQAYNAAKLQGVPSRFLYFENEGHWVSGHQNSLLWHREFYRWLDGYLK